MVAVSRQRIQKRPRRRVRLCKHCQTKPVHFRSPSTGRLKSDRSHDLCTECFWRLVRKVNREARR